MVSRRLGRRLLALGGLDGGGQGLAVGFLGLVDLLRDGRHRQWTAVVLDRQATVGRFEH
jgi:hypothetical protein